MFENKRQKLTPFPHFMRRVALSLALMLLVLCIALGIGLAGYHWIAGLPWIDALLNASMILTGMGPVAPMTTPASKVFASVYALFSGVIFLSSVGILLAPIFHRLLHKFHLDEPGEK